MTQESGIALSAVQNNEAISGTLRNKISEINNLINSVGLSTVRFLGVIWETDSALDSIAQRKSVPQMAPYILTNVPTSDGNYVQGGTTHVVIGMEYANHQYGFQLSLGVHGMMFRNLTKGMWGTWFGLP